MENDFSKAPARFSAAAKAEWSSWPQRVREDIWRNHDEFLAEYKAMKAAGKRDEGMAEFHEMANKAGRPLADIIGDYIGMESYLQQNPEAGIRLLCAKVGIDHDALCRHWLTRPD